MRSWSLHTRIQAVMVVVTLIAVSLMVFLAPGAPAPAAATSTSQLLTAPVDPDPVPSVAPSVAPPEPVAEPSLEPSTPPPPPAPVPEPEPVVAAPPPAPEPPPPPAAPQVTTPGPTREAATVATVAGGTTIHKTPGGEVLLQLNGETDLGSVQTLLVAGGTGDEGWLPVYAPMRPNGTTGWIPAGDAVLSPLDRRIEVDRAARTLVVLSAGVEIARFPVAVGKDSTPTAAGAFYINDKVRTTNPGGAYGPLAMGVSGYSDVYTTFGAGEGEMGIHGTNKPGSIGQAASHGCIRMHNSDIEQLSRLIWLGTPVVIV